MDTAVRDMIGFYGVADDTRHFLSNTPRMDIDERFTASEDGETIDVVERSTA